MVSVAQGKNRLASLKRARIHDEAEDRLSRLISEVDFFLQRCLSLHGLSQQLDRNRVLNNFVEELGIDVTEHKS